jgi:hypothetical protein
MTLISDARPPESPLIETIWRAHSEDGGTFISTAATRGEIVIARWQGQNSITVRGPETQATDAEYPAGAEFFGITLKLGVFMPHLPPALLLDRADAALPTAGDRAFWLKGAAWELPTFDNADTFIDRLARQELLVRDAVVAAALADQPPDFTPRTVRRRFLTATGLTPGTIRQIERARHALTLLRQGRPILDVVFEAGYFDQPHLTRSLRQFMGRTPAQIARPAWPDPYGVIYGEVLENTP